MSTTNKLTLIELKEAENAGNRDPLNRRYFANGKRISREQFDGIKREAKSLDTFYNTSQGGVQTFYCTARMAPIFPPVNFQAEELAYRQALGKTGHSG